MGSTVEQTPALFKTARRYYLRKRLFEQRNHDPEGLEAVWQSKQEAEPGTALPATFPFIDILSACGYTTEVDLDGANVDELRELGLSRLQAEKVLAALAPLI